MPAEQTYVLELEPLAPALLPIPTGLRIVRLADFPDEPDTRRRLYALVRQGVLDTPGHQGDFETFEVFSDHIFGPSYWEEADSQLLALDDTNWVGLTSLRRTEIPQQSAFGLTVVLPSHRRRGLALALKQQAVSLARRRGDRTIITKVHPNNAAMRAVNTRLGFRPQIQ